MEEKRRAYFRRIMEQRERERDEDPSFEEVLQRKEEHGPLTGILFSSWSSGMMMYSLQKKKTSLFLEGDEARFVSHVFSDLNGGTRKTYSVDPDIFRQAAAVCEENSIAAWAALKAHIDPRFIPTDVSGGTSLTLTFDDSELGGYPDTTRSVDLKAVPPQGNRILDKLYQLMKTAEESGGLILEEQLPPRADPHTLFGGMTGGPSPDGTSEPGSEKTPADTKGTAAPDGTWTCPACGQTGNSELFCPSCGSRRPEN